MQGEITYDGVLYLYALFGGVVIVTAPDGRQKKTQLGGSPIEFYRAPAGQRTFTRKLIFKKMAAHMNGAAKRIDDNDSNNYRAGRMQACI